MAGSARRVPTHPAAQKGGIRRAAEAAAKAEVASAVAWALEITLLDVTAENADVRIGLFVEGDKACDGCAKWASKELPNLTWAQIVKHLDAGDMDDLFENHPVLGTATPHLHERSLQLFENNHVGHEMYTKCSALTEGDVTRLYEKSPKTLKLVPYLVPNRPKPLIIYPVRLPAGIKEDYPVLKIFHKTSIGYAAGAFKAQAAELFQKHGQVMFAGTVKSKDDEDAKDDPSNTFNRGVYASIPSHSDITKRKEKAVEKARRGSKLPRADQPDGDSSEQSDLADELAAAASTVAGGAGDPAASSLGPGPSLTIERLLQHGNAGTGENLGPEARRPSGSEVGALLNRSSPCDKRKAGGPSPGSVKSMRTTFSMACDDISANPNSLGTKEYWIHELAYSRGFNGYKSGRAEHQAKQLLAKLTGTEKKTLQTHIDLFNKSKLFSDEASANVDDQELIDAWSDLQKAGAVLTPKALRGLAKRNVMSLWHQVNNQDGSGAALRKRDLLRKFLTACVVRGFDDSVVKKVDDPTKVTLVQGCSHDIEVASTFIEWVFSDTFSNWLAAGAASAEDAVLFCELADEVFSALPEDANLGEAAARCFLEATTVVRLLVALRLKSITKDTDLSIFADAHILDTEARRTNGSASVMQVIGQSLLTSAGGYWEAKLKWAIDTSDAIKIHGPKLKQMLIDLDGINGVTPPKEEHATTMLKIAKDIPYFEVDLYEGVCDAAKNELWAKACRMVESIVAKPSAAATDDDSLRGMALQQWKLLFKELTKLFPTNEHVERAGRDLAAKIADVSEHDRFIQLGSSIDNWTPADESSLVSLMTSVKDNQCKEFPEDVKVQCLALFKRIVGSVFTDGQTSLYTETDSRVFQCLDMVAERVPSQDWHSSTQLGAMIHSCWSVLQLKNAIVAELGEDADLASDVAEQRGNDLFRLISKAKVHFKPLALDAVVENASPNLATLLQECGDFCGSIGEAIRKKHTTVVVDQGFSLCKAIDETNGYSDWVNNKSKVGSLPELITLYEKGIKDAPIHEWQDKITVLEDAIATLQQKSNNFGLDYKGADEKVVETSKAAKQIKSLIIECELCASFANPTLVGNKISLRSAMVAAQSKLRKWELTPDDIDPMLVTRYRDALRMK
ncbi:unnamed protein product [Prorocentrum cordatum]|uniref:Uncharacterized protein n=1 Tax=Prorocentrum cordatum TaxID=2364126 RepID=A0ABN9RV32_9DINO|nr:unnamed protein product [Polarella glacialis]